MFVNLWSQMNSTENKKLMAPALLRPAESDSAGLGAVVQRKEPFQTRVPGESFAEEMEPYRESFLALWLLTGDSFQTLLFQN